MKCYQHSFFLFLNCHTTIKGQDGRISFAGKPALPCSIHQLPSSTHPVELRVEEALCNLRSFMASSSATPQNICDRMRELGRLYSLVEKLKHLTSNQQILIHPVQKKLVEKELDESIKLLDLCSNVKDCLITMKEQIKGVQLALRRGEIVAIINKVNDFVRFGKKANRATNNCLRSLKRMEDKFMNKDDLPTAMRVLMEAKMITISLLQVVLSFLSTQTRKPKSSNWSFVSMALGRREVASEEDEDGSAVQRLDIFSWRSSSYCIFCKDVDTESVLKVQSQLEMFQVGIEELENGLECLFKKLIRGRVSLLNILSS